MYRRGLSNGSNTTLHLATARRLLTYCAGAREGAGDESARLGPGGRRSSRPRRSAWLLLVVNVAILVTALVTAAACCRRSHAGGYLSSGPYIYLPGAAVVQSS